MDLNRKSKTQEWKNVSVFISSTFNDMHAERDYLVKNVFPELSEWCEKRHILLSDIDLRWGVTAQDTNTRNTIRKCLNGVDECRPFFLCILGQRRGWVPDVDEINPETYNEFPEVKSMAEKRSHSATEYEIEHALLAPLLRIAENCTSRAEPDDHVVFLRRNGSFIAGLSEAQLRIYTDFDPDDPAKYEKCQKALEQLYQLISNKYIVIDYECRWDAQQISSELLPLEKNEMDDIAHGRLTDFYVKEERIPPDLRKKLLDALRSNFPAEVPVGTVWPLKSFLLAQYALDLSAYGSENVECGDRYSQDLEQQQAFLQNASRDVVMREDVIRAVRDYCESGSNAPMLILAEAGMGKTTALASYARQPSDSALYIRFLGTSDMSGDPLSLWNSIFHQVGLSSITDLESLRAEINTVLNEIAPAVIILDGLDQLSGGLDMLDWLPSSLPSGIKLVMSIRVDAAPERIRNYLNFHKDICVFSLRPFDQAQKKQLIRNQLALSLKEIDDWKKTSEDKSDMEVLCEQDQTDNPLYLAALLNDLRTFGSYPQFLAEIKRHGTTPQSAFDATLARMEADKMFDMLPPAECVPMVFGLLACARGGLTPYEIAQCLLPTFPDSSEGQRLGSVRICFRQVRAFLSRRSDRTDFRHEAFREAAAQRYCDRMPQFHQVLSLLFSHMCDPYQDGSFQSDNQRALTEYAYHLRWVDPSGGTALFGNVCYLNARCKGLSVRELIKEYADADLSPYAEYGSVLVRYRASLEKYENMLPGLLYRKALVNESFAKLRTPWLKIEASKKSENSRQKAAIDVGGSQCTILAEMSYTTAAFCLTPEKEIAFAFSGRGQISAWRLSDLMPFAIVLHTRKEMPLGMCCDGQHLAAAFEDGKLELFRIEVSADSLRAEACGSLPYYVPYYGTAAMAFDANGRLWIQSGENTLIELDIDSEILFTHPLPVSGELSSLCISQAGLFGTIIFGRDTQVFVMHEDGYSDSFRIEKQDAQVIMADQRGCLLSVKTGKYVTYLLDSRLEKLDEVSLSSPISAACARNDAYLLLPAMLSKKCIWFWQDGSITEAAQSFAYQDAVKLCALADDCFALMSNMSLSRFQIGASESKQDQTSDYLKTSHMTVDAAGILRAGDGGALCDLSDYMLTGCDVYDFAEFIVIAGISGTQAAVMDEQCASVAFLRRNGKKYKLFGMRTFPKVLERILHVCYDQVENCYALVFREILGVSEHTVTLVTGSPERICKSDLQPHEIHFPRGSILSGCFSDGVLYLCVNDFVAAFSADSFEYLTAMCTDSATVCDCDDERCARLCIGSHTFNIRCERYGG